ncbi:MAG: FmdB family zinc ribbon protein [Nitrospinota bacterium]
MPIYEYQCTNCGYDFEIVQKITDRPLKKCEKCGGRLQKLVSNSSFVLKGTGWYKTDYANKSTKTDKKEEKAPETSKKSSEKVSEPAVK